MVNVILCGGSGTRLWPLSRQLMPKQFVKLFSGKSLFQLTLERNKALCSSNIVVSNVEQYFLASDQVDELDYFCKQYLLEPFGRNTAPAIAFACFMVDPDDIVFITPSDHLVKDIDAYQRVVARGKELASAGYLVTFGIKPAYPETGYGYIEADGEQVKSFKEKPTFETARKYIQDGGYYWNSGMFCFRAGVFLDELQKYSLDIYEASKNAYMSAIGGDVTRIKHDDMELIPENSIDYAVMEQSDKVRVVESDIGWSDVGSFDSLAAELPNDERNNFIVSNKHVELIDVNDLIVIDTDDAILISKKGSSQKVKDVVSKLKRNGSELTNIHLTAHRPWGTYTILEDAAGYKIKKIKVKPGKRLSLQKHMHRNEHWIVVSGTATVTVGSETRLVRPNESTYIKMGEVHRLSNEGRIPVVLIEAQVGEYTGEDDIIRLEDDFRRIGGRDA